MSRGVSPKKAPLAVTSVRLTLLPGAKYRWESNRVRVTLTSITPSDPTTVKGEVTEASSLREPFLAAAGASASSGRSSPRGSTGCLDFVLRRQVLTA